MLDRFFKTLLLGLAAAALLAGCGPATATVSGEVTLDGQPLDKGLIVFAPAEGSGDPVRADVVNGRYEVRTTPGKKHVQISATKVVGSVPAHKGPDAPLLERTEERVHERFNSKTELTYDAQAGGNTKNWAVTSKNAKP
jgi:hypothetical protein